MTPTSQRLSAEIRHPSERAHARSPMPSLKDGPSRSNRTRCTASSRPEAAATPEAERKLLGRTSQRSRTAFNRHAPTAPPPRVQCHTSLAPVLPRPARADDHRCATSANSWRGLHHSPRDRRSEAVAPTRLGAVHRLTLSLLALQVYCAFVVLCDGAHHSTADVKRGSRAEPINPTVSATVSATPISPTPISQGLLVHSGSSQGLLGHNGASWGLLGSPGSSWAF